MSDKSTARETAEKMIALLSEQWTVGRAVTCGELAAALRVTVAMIYDEVPDVQLREPIDPLKE